MSIKNVSFIGLGVMGYPMAGHLQNNGYNVTVSVSYTHLTLPTKA